MNCYSKDGSNMKLTDTVDLLYPDHSSAMAGHDRRSARASLPQNYLDDLEAYRIALQFCPSEPDLIMNLMREFSCDIPTIEYRLDCLEDHLREPRLSDELKAIMRRLSDNNAGLERIRGKANSFMEIHMRREELHAFIACIEDMKALWVKCRKRVTSKAMISLFECFEQLDKSQDYLSMKSDLAQLDEAFAKSIRSVTVGINFNHNMVPESCGILTTSNDKIYPKGNILDRLIFRTYEGHTQFEGEEHTNSALKNLAPDLDTALFKALGKYTDEFAQRIADALKSRRRLFFNDIGLIEHQLGIYESAARMINYVRSRGLEMCRPKLLPKESRSAKITGMFDLVFFRQAANAAPESRGEKLVVTNDIELSGNGHFMLVTGVNNGGKTTFARAYGICRLLAQCGMYIPAKSAELSLCDHIFTHFPKEETIGINTSRFTEEIKQLAVICRTATHYSTVVMNESLQSTTPEECLEIARAHIEMLAAAGVSGMYVTHLISLYSDAQKINTKGYPTKIGSLVAEADETTGCRTYKLRERPPLQQSAASQIFEQYGAKLSEITGQQDLADKSRS